MTTVYLGADPELFLTIGGKFISAAGLFPGTKNEPFKIDKGAVQVDGNALEFNIDPATSEDEFNHHFEVVLKQLDGMVKLVDKDIKMEFTPIAEFDKEDWNRIPESAKELGCSPDYNINGQENPNPSDKIYNIPVRTAAGHIHIGWGNHLDISTGTSHFEDCIYVAKKFHVSGLFKPETDEEHKRLEYYGMHGSFRPKPYGVELRSPSNRWVPHEITRRKMFNDVRSNVKHFMGI